MDEKIARLNIVHFKDLLARETDPQKRETIGQLLAQEQAKLAKLTEAGPQDRSSASAKPAN